MALRAGLAWAVITVAWLSIVPSLTAQERDTITLQTVESCAELTFQVEEREPPGRAFNDALFDMLRCPVEGPEVLVLHWRTPPTDPRALRGLIEISSLVLDERVFAELLEVVEDRGAPRDRRLGALMAAGFLADTTRYPWVTEETPIIERRVGADTVPRDFVLWGGRTKPNRRPDLTIMSGAQPIAGDPVERLVEVLARMTERPDEDWFMVAVARGGVYGAIRRPRE